MIEEDDAAEAIRSLHSTFFADPDANIFDIDARANTAGAPPVSATAPRFVQ